MEYHCTVRDPNGTDMHVKLDRGLLVTRVSVNGTPLRRSREKGRPFVIPMSDGSIRRMTVGTINLFDFAPRVLVDGQEVFSAEQLQSYQYLWAGLPLLFFLLGSPVGGLIGICAAVVNLKIFRSALPAAIQVLATLGVTILSGIIWMFIAISIAG